MKQIIENTSKNQDIILSLGIFIFSIGFLIVGLSSYFQYNFNNSTKILFFPQGITMIFYGTLGFISSTHQFINLYFKVGEGFNEFDKEKGKIKIYRNNFPGTNANIEYLLKDILRIKTIFKIKNKKTLFNYLIYCINLNNNKIVKIKEEIIKL